MKNLPPLKTLPAFVAVADHASFSKAADSLHVTHSAVSQSIKNLERFLGVTLFHRQANQPITLTLKGEHYYPLIRDALATIQSATRQQLGTPVDNRLTVNSITTLTMMWLIPRLPNFQKKHPKVDIRLSALARKVNFVEDNVDIEITYDLPNKWPGHYTHKLFDDQLILVGNQAMKKTSLTFKHSKAIYVSADLRKNDWKKWCKQAGIAEPLKSKRILFQNSTQAITAARNGVGIAVTHELLVIDDIKQGILHKLSDVSVPLNKGYYIVCSEAPKKGSKQEKFINWLLEEAALTTGSI